MPAVPPRDCADMPALRAQIDRIDRQLIALYAERFGYIARAAEIKTDRNRVHDSARIEDVVAKVKAEAQRLGVCEEFAEAIWRETIARSIAFEYVRFDEVKG
jgi:isochorismate pyruvate lyase